MYQKSYHIHFVGIGGIGMSGIAELLLNLGYRVSGSDLKASDLTRRLEGLGGSIAIGHDGAHVSGADVVVVSSAIAGDNPEVAAARADNVPVIARAEMLAELMRLKFSVAVAGAHGKTTTTSMVAAVLAEGRLDPTVVVGGKLLGLGANAVLGQGDFLVAEADESDGSFLRFSPAIAVVTNIDREHLDFYRDLEQIKQVFCDFLDRIPFYGLAVLCLDNEHVQAVLPKIKKRYVTYGLNPQADLQARRVAIAGTRSTFEVWRQQQRLGRIELNLPGRHNVYNAMAAVAVGLELDLPFETIQQALKGFKGVQRRLEIKGQAAGVTVVDDYGHHPTEIRATLEALAAMWPDRRKVVVFQPHRYSRTKALGSDFTRAFYQSDVLLVMPIYAASETPLEGVDAVGLSRGIRAHGHRDVRDVADAEQALATLEQVLQPGDVVLTLGAGDVWRLGETLMQRLAASAPE